MHVLSNNSGPERHLHILQIRCEGFIRVDDRIWRYVLLAVRLPERAKLRTHVAPLVVRVLVARRHLFHRVDVDVDVSGRVRRVEHLTEGEDEAASGVLRMKKGGMGAHIDNITATGKSDNLV